jgi:hypothetical protein
VVRFGEWKKSRVLKPMVFNDLVFGHAELSNGTFCSSDLVEFLRGNTDFFK